jgi:hypothetical protein
MSEQPNRTHAAGLPPLLSVAEVMARYCLRDRRAARRLMDAAGAFVAGGRLLVRVDDLLAHEELLIAARAPTSAQASAYQPRTRPVRTRPVSRPPLAPGWWREDAQGARGLEQPADQS